jgi:hypothetical protein
LQEGIKRNLYWFYLGFLLIGPVVLFILPADFFDHSTIELCLSKILFDRSCIGCGITRAVMHFIHLEFDMAMQYNKLVVLVIPLILYLWGKELFKVKKYLSVS